MADNVTLPGTGSSVAADDVGGALYQRVKVSLGADGAAADLAPGQALMAASVPVAIASDQGDVAITLDGEAVAVTNAGITTIAGAVAGTEMQVDIVAPLPAGTNAIGDVTVTSPDIVVTVTPTLDTNAYASGDLLFDSTEVAAAVRANGGHAVLQSVTVIDKADQKVAFTLLFANAATDFGTLNSAPDPDDTETATVIGWVPIAAADYIDLGANAVACVRNLGLVFKAGAATTSLYIAGVNGTGTPTYAASDLVFQLGFMRS